MEEFRMGFVAIIGRPNAGKSALVNSFVKRKEAVASKRPQTNRHKIRCIVNRPQAQIIFVDIPGFHKPKATLGKNHNKEVRKALKEVDVILFLVDVSQVIGSEDGYIAKELQKLRTPAFLALNKVDKIGGSDLEAQLEVGKHLGNFKSIIPTSALEGEGLDVLLQEIESYLPKGSRLYPDEA